MNTDFLKAAGERALKTFAQSILALLGTDSIGITSLAWSHIIPVALTAALASVLTSFASLSTLTPGPVVGTPPVVLNLPDAKPAVSFADTQAKVDAVAPVEVTPVEVTPLPPTATPAQ